jgi:hypothetical protein
VSVRDKVSQHFDEAVIRRLADIGIVILLAEMPVSALATHPLITDDTETQGKGAVLVAQAGGLLLQITPLI